MGSAGGGRRFVEFSFDSQLKEVSLEYSFTPDISVMTWYLELSILIEDDDLLMKSKSDLNGSLFFKYEDEPLGYSRSPGSFRMECYRYEFEVRSACRTARRRGGKGVRSAKMIVLSRSFPSFLSWANFLQYEERGRKARGDVAAYTAQPMPLV